MTGQPMHYHIKEEIALCIPENEVSIMLCCQPVDNHLCNKSIVTKQPLGATVKLTLFTISEGIQRRIRVKNALYVLHMPKGHLLGQSNIKQGKYHTSNI